MKILFLGPGDSPLIQHLKNLGEAVTNTADRVILDYLHEEKPEFLISYGYRYILKTEIIAYFLGKAINLHISFLPWNRGADPNFWSFLEDTPKGVTIHYLDAGIDTGDIIVQARVAFTENETLKTSYEKLQKRIQELFIKHWQSIRQGTCSRTKQSGRGTFHLLKDKESFVYLLANGWDTPVKAIGTRAAVNDRGV